MERKMSMENQISKSKGIIIRGNIRMFLETLSLMYQYKEITSKEKAKGIEYLNCAMKTSDTKELKDFFMELKENTTMFLSKIDACLELL